VQEDIGHIVSKEENKYRQLREEFVSKRDRLFNNAGTYLFGLQLPITGALGTTLFLAQQHVPQDISIYWGAFYASQAILAAYFTVIVVCAEVKHFRELQELKNLEQQITEHGGHARRNQRDLTPDF